MQIARDIKKIQLSVLVSAKQSVTEQSIQELKFISLSILSVRTALFLLVT